LEHQRPARLFAVEVATPIRYPEQDSIC